MTMKMTEAQRRQLEELKELERQERLGAAAAVEKAHRDLLGVRNQLAQGFTGKDREEIGEKLELAIGTLGFHLLAALKTLPADATRCPGLEELVGIAWREFQAKLKGE